MNHHPANALSFPSEPRRLALAAWLAVSALFHVNVLLWLCSRGAAAAVAPVLELELAQEPPAADARPDRTYVDMPDTVADETPPPPGASNIGLRNLLARDNSPGGHPSPTPRSDIGVDAPVYHLGGSSPSPPQETPAPPAPEQAAAEAAPAAHQPAPPARQPPTPEAESEPPQKPLPPPEPPPLPAAPAPAPQPEPAVEIPAPDPPAAEPDPEPAAIAISPAPPPEPQPKPEPEPNPELEPARPPAPAPQEPQPPETPAPARPRIAARVPGSSYTLSFEEGFIPKTPQGSAALRGAPQYNVKWDEYAPYYKRLFARIRAAMELRERLSYRRPLLLQKPQRVVISFKLLRDGGFQGLSIDDDGGLPLVASDLAGGVRSASPVDAFPPYIKEDALDIQIRVYVE